MLYADSAADLSENHDHKSTHARREISYAGLHPQLALCANVAETADLKRLVSRAMESSYDDQWNEQHDRS